MTATTRAEHVRHATNAALHEYACDLAAIREMRHEATPAVLRSLFTCATEQCADELERLAMFGAGEA